MTTLIFDIETVGEKFEEMDETTKNVLTKWYRENTVTEEEYRLEEKRLKKRLGFSALHGEIVAIGVMDADTGKGAVYYQTPNAAAESAEGEVKLIPTTEKEMLERFWKVAASCKYLVGFNSRGFDVSFLNIRSAIYGIRPPLDLLSNRYLFSQRGGIKHIDLLDQLTFYGSAMKKGGLHLWCRAFGIESPKAGDVTGDDVGRLFDGGEYEKIARYNIGDLLATRELFHRWHQFLDFQLPR